MAVLDYPFSSADLEAASKEWGCNCGPSALAFALQLTLDTVRGAIPEFERKRYTSPSMMRAALDALRLRPFEAVSNPTVDDMFRETPALVRIQWSGPWTKPGSNPRWGYWYTHWIATWMDGPVRMIFDCNGGMFSPEEWESEIVPMLTSLHKRADGGWYPTHVWRLT